MNMRHTRRWAASIVLCVLSAGATTLAQTSLPNITLQRGEFYFRLDGKPSFLLGTNPTGWMPGQFQTLLGWAGQSERIVRIHLTNGRVPRSRPGEVDEDWAIFWDQ